jgi:hypothetical protein
MIIFIPPFNNLFPFAVIVLLGRQEGGAFGAIDSTKSDHFLHGPLLSVFFLHNNPYFFECTKPLRFSIKTAGA